MGKNVAKGKIANKLQSKKNKKHMKSGNQVALKTSKSIGTKFNAKNTPKAKLNAQNKGGQKKEIVKKSEKIQKMAQEEEEIILPDPDMMSDSDSDQDMRFLDNVAESKQIEKLERMRKRQIENSGEGFEQTKRSFNDVGDERKRTLLPTVDINTGQTEDRYQNIAIKEINDLESDSSEDEEEKVENKEMTIEEIRELQDEQLGQWSTRLVQASNRAMANPEEHALSALKLFVQALHFDGDKRYLPILVRQRAMLSGGKVLEDILPGYRIRKLTETEMKEKVKKEVKVLRAYEQGLLEGYQKFLKRVEFFLRLYKTPQASQKEKRRRKNAGETDPSELLAPAARLALARSAIKTLSKLMVSTTHFNFHENLIETVVPHINDFDEQVGEEVEGAIGELFRTDRKGDKILSVVRKIAGIVRSKGHKVNARLINVLLKLRIKQVEQKRGKDEKDKEREKTDRSRVSRAQNKQRKKEAKLMQELKETQAVENQDDRLHHNSQTIEAIFGIYFRILKSARNGPLMGAVLIGIGKFAHLINLNLIGPLLTLLGDVLGDKHVPLHNRLKAAKSAAAILSGDGEDLLVDPRQLYLHTYQIMDKIRIEIKTDKEKTSNHKGDPWPALFDVLWAILIDRKKHLNNGRVNAFLHRILTLCVRLTAKHGAESSPFVLSLLLVVRSCVIHHRCTKSCLDDEAEMSSLPVDRLDPDLVQSNRVCCTKELATVAEHPDKLVQILARHIIAGAPSNVKLPRNMARKRPVEIYRESRYGFLKGTKEKTK